MPEFSGLTSEMYAVRSSPAYGDVFGGGSTNTHLVDPRTADSVASSKVYKFAQDLKESLKGYRSNYDTNWPYYYNVLKGRQWVQPGGGSVRSPRMQSWKTRLNINHLHSVEDTILSTIFDTAPKISVKATAPEQSKYVDALQSALDQVWDAQELNLKCQDAFMAALTYGTGYLKVLWNPEGADGQGCVEVYFVPSENLYVDKMATSFLDCEAVMEVKTVPLSFVRRQFPNKAEYLRADTSKGTYAERKTGNQTPDDWLNRPVDILSPGQTLVPFDTRDLGIDSIPAYRHAKAQQDFLVEVTEIWIKDYSKKFVDQTYIREMTPWGPVYGTRQVEVDAYPHGRLITIGGGLVLQDVPNPYRVFPPYVLFRDLVDPGEFYGRGEPDLLIDLQLEVNKRRSQLMDAGSLMGNPVWTKTSDACPDHMITNTPGAIINIKPGSQLTRQSPPEMPAWMRGLEDKPAQDIYVISGVAGASGSPPRGIRSGAGFQEANSFMTQRIRRKSQRVEQSYKDLGKALITFIQDFYTTAHMVRIQGNYNNVAFVPFDGKHARGQWDLTVEAGSAVAATKTARRQEAIQLYTMGVIDDLDLLEKLEWPGKEEILRRKGRSLTQIPLYPGYPGMPNPDRTDSSGYSLSVRTREDNGPPPGPPPGPGGPPMGPPPTAPPGMPPAGAQKNGGPRPKKPPHHAATRLQSPAMGLLPFGSPIGASHR